MLNACNTLKMNKQITHIKAMKHLFYLILTLLFISCNSASNISEHEAICHISGDGFNVRDVRICLIRTDMRNGDDYQEIKVRKGRFESDVVLDTNQVYEICVPDPEYGYAAYKTLAFFYSKDGVQFGIDSAIDGQRITLTNPSGDNYKYYDYKNRRDSLYMDRYTKLMEQQDSLNNIGEMYDPVWLEMCNMQNNEHLPQSVRDSITIEVNSLAMSNTNRTPAGQLWLQEWNKYRSDKQDYDYNYLSSIKHDNVGLLIIMDNIRISKSRNKDISKWLNIYEDNYKLVNPSNKIHSLISLERDAAAMVEGIPYIDFSLPDKFGKAQTLSELINGKIAVIELWASWCKSCRVNAKSFIPLYEQYKNRGFEIVGISREYKDIHKWLNVLEVDQYPWPNMVAMEENHHIWAQYGIPNMAGRTVLVSRDGVVIKIDPTVADVEKYLTDNK